MSEQTTGAAEPQAKRKVNSFGLQLAKRDARIAELERQLAEGRAGVAAPAAAPAERPPPAPPAAQPKDADPLAWITEDTEEVFLVGRDSALLGHMFPTPPGLKREDYREPLAAYGSMPWSTCPFSHKGRNDEETRNLRIMNSAYWHYRVDRFWASGFFAGKYAEMPRTAIIDPAAFSGADRLTGVLRGGKAKASGIALRELVRWWLQKYAGNLWLDAGRNPKGAVDWKNPNPYGRGSDGHWDRVAGNPVVTATEDGDLKRGGA